jgi:hypothetical protein
VVVAVFRRFSGAQPLVKVESLILTSGGWLARLPASI